MAKSSLELTLYGDFLHHKRAALTTTPRRIFTLDHRHQGEVKRSDGQDPVSRVQPPKGHAGTCLVWRKDLNHCIRPLPDGDRLVAVEVRTVLELQWLEHLWNHDIMFDTEVVRANECYS